MWAMLMREINGSLGIPLLLPTLLQVLELTLRECHKNLKQLPHLLSTCIFVNLHINELNIDSIWINVILFKTWTLISILNNVDVLELRKMKMFKLPKKKLQNCPSFFLFPQNLFYFSSSFFFFSSEQNIFLPHFSPLLSFSKNVVSVFFSIFLLIFFAMAQIIDLDWVESIVRPSTPAELCMERGSKSRHPSQANQALLQIISQRA